jgi:hypothetical protein
MMRKAYSYTARGRCKKSGHEIDALCVFVDTKRSVSALEFFDELETSLRELETLPDCMVVLAHGAMVKALSEHWTDESAQRRVFENRGFRKGVPFIKSYYLVGLAANLAPYIESLLGTESLATSFDIPIDSFIQQGLHALIDLNPVVQIAPAGHVFKHPSRTVNKLFIQARELATSEAQLAFVGTCLCRALTPLADAGLAVVYIDTMGIYSLVREALMYADSKATIHSFHSYTKLSELSPPTEAYAVVISASTSGGMARRLHIEQGFSEERLLTLVDTTKDGRKGKVMIALDEIDVLYRKQLADGTETQIELFGEHFSSKAKPPRAVTLGQPHFPKRLNEFLRRFGHGGLLELNEKPAGETTSRLVCLDRKVAGSDPILLKWLNDEIDWRVSVAIEHVIHADDEGSKALAKAAADRLHSAKGCSIKPVVTAYADLTAGTLSEAQGVLVVQAVAGDGGLLREISRDLREFVAPDVPRHFLAGVGLPQSEETWQRLQQFLVRNASSRDYGFSTWLVLPIGSDGASNAWEDLSALAERAQMNVPEVSGVDKTIVSDSVDLAVQLVKNAFNGFLPRSCGAPLTLSEGFVFFGDVFSPGKALPSVSTTYATVAAVLQAARDLNVPANQLKPSGYESVVLSPENFLRYNDSRLQACVLRAAHPSELDYSSSPHLSRLMKEFLLKVFTRNAHPYGSASLEFAAALACDRLKLIADDRNELKQKAIELLSGKPSALFGLICLLS